jgi:hypothetical protein
MTEEEFKENIAELGITSDPTDLDAMRLEIKARISELHPDHQVNHGDDRLQRLTELLKNTGSDTRELQRVVGGRQLIKPGAQIPTQGEPVEARINKARAAYQRASSRGFLFPKISLMAVTGALAWVFAFPKAFMDHPFISPLLKSRFAIGMWLVVLLALAVAWIAVWWSEQHKQRMIEKVMSLAHQRAVLDSIGREDEGSFSASQFREALYPRHIWYSPRLRMLASVFLRRKIYYFHDPFYDVTLEEQAAELALERFVKKGWTVATKRPKDESKIDDWYEFS